MRRIPERSAINVPSLCDVLVKARVNADHRPCRTDPGLVKWFKPRRDQLQAEGTSGQSCSFLVSVICDLLLQDAEL